MDTNGREFSEGKNEEDEWADSLTTDGHGWTRMDTNGREFWEGKNEEDEWANFLTTAEHG